MASFVDGVAAALGGSVVSKPDSSLGTIYMHVGKVKGNTLYLIISKSEKLPNSVKNKFKSSVEGFTSSTSANYKITFTEDMWSKFGGRISLSGNQANSHSFLGADWTY